MITINKNPPLLQLLQARRTIVNTDEPYDALDTDTKDAIRRSLCEEQGYLCAYCMRRIEPTKDPKTNQEEFGEQLKNVLNLNNEVLLNNRLSVLNGVQDSLERLAPNTTINQTKLQNFLNKYQSLNTQGKKHPYCGIVIYYLQRKLKATNS